MTSLSPKIPPGLVQFQRLTASDVERLVYLAPYYAMQLRTLGSSQTLEIVKEESLALQLPYEEGIIRVLSEICSATTPWLFYNPKLNCERTLLNETDIRLKRLAAKIRSIKAEAPLKKPL